MSQGVDRSWGRRARYSAWERHPHQARRAPSPGAAPWCGRRARPEDLMGATLSSQPTRSHCSHRRASCHSFETTRGPREEVPDFVPKNSRQPSTSFSSSSAPSVLPWAGKTSYSTELIRWARPWARQHESMPPREAVSSSDASWRERVFSASAMQAACRRMRPTGHGRPGMTGGVGGK